MARRIHVWSLFVAMLLVLSSSLATVAKAPTGSARDDVDMRGQWRLRWTIHYPKDTIDVIATMVVERQDQRTGKLTGRYDIKPQVIGKYDVEAFHSKLTGTVRKKRAHLITSDGDFDVRITQGASGPTFRGSQTAGEIHGDVVGTLVSAWVRIPTVIPVCVQGLTGDGSSVECLLTVSDASDDTTLVTPTGTLRVTLAGTDRPTDRCTLRATRTGAASCRVTIDMPTVPPPGTTGPTSTRTPAPTDAPVTVTASVDYRGDDRFDPGEVTASVLPMKATDAAATAALIDAFAAALRKSRDILETDQRYTVDRVLPQMDTVVDWLREWAATGH